GCPSGNRVVHYRPSRIGTRLDSEANPVNIARSPAIGVCLRHGGDGALQLKARHHWLADRYSRKRARPYPYRAVPFLGYIQRTRTTAGPRLHETMRPDSLGL